MKPSPKNRCARTIVRDFLVGLAVFLTVFTLAMLDPRTSHSAPAFVSKAVISARSEAITPAKVTTGAFGHQVTEGGAADFEASVFTLSRPDAQELASEDLPATFPAVKMNSALPGSGKAAEPAGKNSKLAMNIGKRKAGMPATHGTPEAGERTWILTVMAMVFAAMTALTLGLWRHLRLSVAPRRGGRRV